MNETPSWARRFTTAADIVGTPTGKVSLRPFPGGQKVGVLSPLNNLTFSEQTCTKQALLASYPANALAEGDGNPHNVCVDITTPSARLRCGVQLFWRRRGVISDQPTILGGTPATATLYATGVDPTNGGRGNMQVIQTYNLPASIQIDPAYRAVRLVVKVQVGNVGEVYECDLELVANWEPVVEMSSMELNRLYSACTMNVPQTVLI